MNILQSLLTPLTRTAQTAEISPIGLHLSQRSLHAVQFRINPNSQLQLQAKVSIPYPDNIDTRLKNNIALSKFIKKCLRSDKFVNQKIVSAIPADYVKVMSISYTSNTGKTDVTAITKVLKERISGKLSDYVIDYLPVRADRSNSDRLSIVAIAQQTDVIDYLELIRHAGYNVDALEIGPLAIKRLVWVLSKDAIESSILVINFGAEKTFLTMISGRRLLFDQAVDFGEEHLLKNLCQSLKMDEATVMKLVQLHGIDPVRKDNSLTNNLLNDDTNHILIEIVKPLFLTLVEEIKRSLLYAAAETRGQSVSIIYLLGSIARWPGADRLLNQLMNLPVATMNPLTIIESDDTATTTSEAEEEKSSPQIAIATGLALRGVYNYD